MKLFAWMPRPFASWIEFLEYLVFITVCVAGVLNASWLWRLVGALYAKAFTLPIVLAAKIGHDALFLAGAFVFGHLIRWVWIG